MACVEKERRGAEREEVSEESGVSPIVLYRPED